jgi:hypothetical protein
VTNQFKCHWTCQSCAAENDRFSCTGCSNNSYLSVMGTIGGLTPVGYCKPQCKNSEYNLVIGQKKFCYSSIISLFAIIKK